MNPIQWWRSNFLFAEFALSVVLAAALGVWGEVFSGSVVMDSLLGGNRAEVYSAFATIFGALLGFAITATSIALGYSASERLTIVRETRHYPMLWRTFGSANRALAFATIIALVGLILDRDTSPNRLLVYLNAFGAALSMFRVARCLWVLDNVMSLVTSGPRQTGAGQ